MSPHDTQGSETTATSPRGTDALETAETDKEFKPFPELAYGLSREADSRRLS